MTPEEVLEQIITDGALEDMKSGRVPYLPRVDSRKLAIFLSKHLIK